MSDNRECAPLRNCKPKHYFKTSWCLILTPLWVLTSFPRNLTRTAKWRIFTWPMKVAVECGSQLWLDIEYVSQAQPKSTDVSILPGCGVKATSINLCFDRLPPMRLRPLAYGRLFRLSNITSALCDSATQCRRARPTFSSGSTVLFSSKFTMHSSKNAASHVDVCSSSTRQLDTELLSNIPTITAGDNGSPIEKRRLETPSPQFEANCDDDSEAESFADGRREEVDRDTRDRAFAWCKEFLSGSWKSIQEEDFQISIVRSITNF